MSEELNKLRVSIDEIDAQMLKLLNQRAEVAQRIGHLKSGVAYKPEREAEVLRGVMQKNPGPLSDDTAAHLFREIMSACLALEKPVQVAYAGITMKRGKTRAFQKKTKARVVSTTMEVLTATP